MLRQTLWIAYDMLRARYAAARLGAAWAVAQPALLFFVFWFVSVYGLKMTAPTGIPFFAYLFGGLLPWVTFSGAVSDGAAAISGNRHLVVQSAFPLIVVPVAAVIANLFVHVPLLFIVVTIFVVAGVPVGFTLFAVPLYFVGLGAISLAIVLPLSVLSVRSADIAQAVGVLLLLMFWLTPIVWPTTNVPAEVLTFLKLNPLFWVVEGYRFSLIATPPTFGWVYTVYFWSFALVSLVTGYLIFQRQRKHLGEFL